MTKKIISSNSNSIKICSVGECNNPRYSKGYCRKHYSRLWRNGSVEVNCFEPNKFGAFCNIADCKNKHASSGYCAKHFARMQRHGNPNYCAYDYGKGNTYEERFWSKVDKTSSANGCWEWSGRVLSTGYGQVRFEKESWLTHRLSWFLFNKRKTSMLILHSCDNRICVNPEHLREGTHLDNTNDKVSRNRQAKGETNGRVTLTESQVFEIRKLLAQKVSHRKIGSLFGVNKSTITNINRGKTWKHI